MVIKMRRDNIARHIVRRMLDRCEPVDIHAFRQNDYASRMLTGRSPNADAALCKPLKLTVLFRNAFILKIMPGQSVGRLFRDRTDRPGLECLSLAEDDLGISLRNPLLIAGEIQVYIRFLVTLESKECLERYIESHFLQGRAADRAIFIRHIRAAAASVSPDLIGIEINVVAFRTQVMRGKRIDLCNVGHGSHKRGTDRSSGTDQITVLPGLLHKPLRDNVHDRIAVLNNRSQLLIQS